MYKVWTMNDYARDILHVGDMGSCIDYCFSKFGDLLTFYNRGDCLQVLDESPKIGQTALCVIEPCETNQ